MYIYTEKRESECACTTWSVGIKAERKKIRIIIKGSRNERNQCGKDDDDEKSNSIPNQYVYIYTMKWVCRFNHEMKMNLKTEANRRERKKEAISNEKNKITRALEITITAAAAATAEKFTQLCYSEKNWEHHLYAQKSELKNSRNK